MAGASARTSQDLRDGPDLLGDTFDEDEALRRVRAHDSEAIADVLLNQRVVAGSATSTSRKCCSSAA
jgi:formamidopyrimidine-DNA glycosylase